MSVIFDSSWLQLLHKPPQHRGKVGDLVVPEVGGEHGGGRVGVGRHGGPLDFITSRWQIHTIRGTSHIIRPPPHMN